MDKETIFIQLVENAFDFHAKSIDQVKTEPKYSVINFSTAVELFVKARLMKEHWTLVVEKPNEANWNKFMQGDFKSVSLNEAAKRLKNIVQSRLSDEEIDAFENVRNDRNRMVHFFYVDKENKFNVEEKIGQDIAKKHLKAWYFLHELLTDKWKEEFSSFSQKISEHKQKLTELKEFLQAIFEEKKTEIKENKEKGFIYEQCPSCDFPTQEHNYELNRLYEANCLVCGFVQNFLKIECPSCEETINIEEGGYSHCRACDETFDIDKIKEVLSENNERVWGGYDNPHSHDANCHECEDLHSVIYTKNDGWICLNCLQAYESVEKCEWCDVFNTGDMRDSYVAGCGIGFCDGLIGHYRDK